MKVLVRHDGQVVTHDAEEVCRELLDDLDEEPDFDLIGFVVRNMGWVWFEEKGRKVEVQFNPSTVTLAAIVTVVSTLVKSPARLFTLRYLDAMGWVVERFNDHGSIVRKLDLICATSFSDSGSKFRIEPMSVTSITDRKMRGLMDCWTSSNATFSVGVIGTFIQHELTPRMVIVQGDRHVLRFVGDALINIGGTLGMPIRDLPDREYGAWLEPHYREVSVRQVPRHDRITATIDTPTVSRVVTYNRLMLPWRCSGTAGTIVTTLSTRVVPPIDFTRVEDRVEHGETLACSLYRSIKALLGVT